MRTKGLDTALIRRKSLSTFNDKCATEVAVTNATNLDVTGPSCAFWRLASLSRQLTAQRCGFSSVVSFFQAQYVGDDIFEIIALEHNVRHVVMRGLQHENQRRA